MTVIATKKDMSSEIQNERANAENSAIDAMRLVTWREAGADIIETSDGGWEHQRYHVPWCADKFMLVAGLWTDGCAAIRGNEAKLKKLT